jgi:hypothetical protein
MVNYANSKIYKIEPTCEHDEGDIYIGSTTKKYLCQRMDSHRSAYKRWKEGKFHKYTSFDIFDKYGIEKCDIILLETIKCNSKDELQAQEKYFIKNFKCVNRNFPQRSDQEYRTDNKELIDFKRREKDKIKQQCDCGVFYSIRNKPKHLKSLKHIQYIELQN